MIDYKIIKIGGSLISPYEERVNKPVLSSYIETIKEIYARPDSKDLRLILIVGGGSTSRLYRDTALELGEDCLTDQHRIGITATWLNAELLRALIDDLAYKRVLGLGVYAENKQEGEDRIAKEFQDWLSGNVPIIVGGGFINGASTDLNAILLASKIGVDRIFKLSNIDYVYTDDPQKNPLAERIERQSWQQYLEMFGEEGIKHAPGANLPIDLFGAKLARDSKVSCVFVDGRNPENFRNILLGKEIQGTYLHS